MIIKTDEELNALKRIGRIVALTIDTMRQHLEPGMTTAELDAIGKRVLDEHGAVSAPKSVYKFPGITCISVNDSAAHGIPGDYVIQPGDLVNIDVSASLDGYFGDSGASFPVPPTTALQQKLVDSTREALDKAMFVARAGRPIQMIGRAVEGYAKQQGFEVIRNLGGHGIGKKLHEAPNFIPHFFDRSEHRKLKEGTVLTLEPFLTTGAREVVEADDGWTMKTVDGSLSAQFEHTMVITRGEPIVLTRL